MSTSAVIRHVCRGHEYRYDTQSGDIRNNYGRVVSTVRICRFTGIAQLYDAKNLPKLYAADLLESMRRRTERAHLAQQFTDAELAQFGIGQTAVLLPES